MFITDQDLSGLGAESTEAKFKWQGGKAGELSPEGVPYGTPMSQAQPIIDAYNKRRAAAAAGFSDLPSYLAYQKQAADVAANAPLASIFGANAANPLGMSTLAIATLAGLAVGGAYLWKRYRKGKRK